MTRQLYATRNQYPNLPGWTAYIAGEDDLGPDNITGHGNTRDEAVADLEEQLAEQASTYLEEIEARCDTGPCEYWLREIGASRHGE